MSNKFMRFTLAAVSTALVATLSACGGAGSSKSSGTANNKSTKPSAKATSSSKATDKPQHDSTDTVEAIVLGRCNLNGGRSLVLLDPKTGGILSTRYIMLSPGQSTLFSCMGARTGAMERAAFDKGFDKLAIRQSMQDNESLVGYVTPSLIENDAATGSIRDLSGASADDDGFGAKKERSIPAFNPTTGKLVFVEEGDPGRLLSVDTNVEPTEVATPTQIPDSSNTVNSTGDDDALYFFPHSGKVQNDYRTREVYSANGALGFRRGETNYIVYGDLANNKTTRVELPIKDGNYVGLTPVAYLSKTSFIALSGVSHNLMYHVTVDGTSLKYEPMLPETDGTIYDVTLSPNGKNMTFFLQKSDSFKLFTATVGSGIQQFHELRDLAGDGPSSYLNAKVLDWATVKK